MIEEIFNREIEDDNDDNDPATEEQGRPEAQIVSMSTLSEVPGTQTNPIPEKLNNRMRERAAVFEHCVKMNRLLKTQQAGAPLRNCLVQRVKFEGPDSPMDLIKAPEEGVEAPLENSTDQDKRAAQNKLYEDFSKTQLEEMEKLAVELAEYRALASVLEGKAKPLWEAKMTPE
jgi:hypothetical protein